MRQRSASSSKEIERFWQKRELEERFHLLRVAVVPNLSNDRGQSARNMGKGQCCSGFGEQVCQFITVKSSLTGDPLKA